jgi:hypothetical protein
MSYHFLQQTYGGTGNLNNLTSDNFWLNFVKFMTKTPGNGGPGWTLKAYGLGLDNTTGAVRSFQINGNYDPNVVWTSVDLNGASSFSACGTWFILKEPATNRNYQREFLFHRGNKDYYYAQENNFSNYCQYIGGMNVYYSAQGFLTTSTGNGFNATDVSGKNPPIAYDMINLGTTSHRNPSTASWNWTNPELNTYPVSIFTQSKNGASTHGMPWQYTVCAADNSNGEGYGWYILAYIKGWAIPAKFVSYDPFKLGTYDTQMLDPVVVLNQTAPEPWTNSFHSSMFYSNQGLMSSNATDYTTSNPYNLAYSWVKRPSSFSSKADSSNQTQTTYAAQVCAVCSMIACPQQPFGIPIPTNGNSSLVPLAYISQNYPNYTPTKIWLGESSIFLMNINRNTNTLQAVNVGSLRDYLSVMGVGANTGYKNPSLLVPWDGSIPSV